MICTQQILRSAWASALSDQSSQCALWVAKDPNFLQADRPWMDELGFNVISTVFQSFRDDGRVNMKGSVQ